MLRVGDIQTCRRKKSWGNRPAVLHALERMKLNGVWSPSLSPYICNFCKRWHIGNERPISVRKMRL